MRLEYKALMKPADTSTPPDASAPPTPADGTAAAEEVDYQLERALDLLRGLALMQQGQKTN